MNEKTNRGVLYAVIGMATLIVAIIGATFAYFSATVNSGGSNITGTTLNLSDSTLTLNVSRVNFNQSVPDDLVPAIFGTTPNVEPPAQVQSNKDGEYSTITKFLESPEQVSAVGVSFDPSSMTTTEINRALNASCVSNGYTGCHVWKIQAHSTNAISSASILLDLYVSAATVDKSQWSYAIYTGTDSTASSLATVPSGSSAVGGFGSPSLSGLDINNGASFTANETKTYYLMVYINNLDTAQNTGEYDATGVYNGEVTLQVGTGRVSVKFTNGNEPNSPDLVQGLIPVVYDSTNEVWVKADSTNTSNSWYDYDNKEWANAVLVKEEATVSGVSNNKDNIVATPMGVELVDSESHSRSYYETAAAGTEIAEEDILAYYVWIPRYKYRVWNISKQAGAESTYAYNAYTEGIDIVFEQGTSTTGTISCSYNFNVDTSNGGIDLSTTTAETCTGSNGDYYTHPAFTFGSTNLRGFWIGKFELSSDIADGTGSNYGGGTSTSYNPLVLPNAISWRNNPVDNFWQVIYNMQQSNNIYGLSTSRVNTDSHMLTNMEWGAVAYLTNSNYGRCSSGSCTEVSMNNSGEDNYWTSYTGRSAGLASNTAYTANGSYEYNNLTYGVLASTTGNITGVYDMSGGEWEYVMGNESSSTSNYTYYARGAGSNYTYTGNEKYVTTYAYGTTYNAQTAYNRGRLGDATSEVVLDEGYGWYDDYSVFVEYDDSWFVRGGHFYGGSGAGSFRFEYDNGGASLSRSARAALVSVVQ